MAAKPKMTPEEWASARAAWEADPREGYVWLVEALGLDVSVQSVRKAALKGGWAKVTPGNHAKASVTIKTTMPTTMPEAISGPCDGGVVTAGREGESALTPREERFVQEYLVDLSAAQAYARAYPDAAEASARTLGPRLLSKVRIAAAVEKAKAERAARTGITADRALAEVWAVATADPRELVQVKVGCCRCCYGEGHARQRTVGEMNRDREKHAAKGKDLADFDEEGGIGFNPHLPPNSECPDCCGDGNARVVLADTRNLSPAAVALYAGAKQGKYGIEVLLQGKAEAQRKVFEHLGLNKQVVEVNLNLFPPAEALDAIYEKALSEAAEREKMLLGRRERLGIVIENGGAHE